MNAAQDEAQFPSEAYVMAHRPTYEELENRVLELEETLEGEATEKAFTDSDRQFRMLAESAPFGISIMKSRALIISSTHCLQAGFTR